MKRAVEINAGSALVPATTVEHEVARGVMKAIPMRGRQFVRPLAIIHRKSRVLTPAMKKFIGTLTGKPFMEPEDESAEPRRRIKVKKDSPAGDNQEDPVGEA